MILVPAVITLAVTLLRLVGELQGWSPTLFSREAGGGASLVGITWLVPFFGAWFGWKLARSGAAPGRVGRALGIALLALAIVPALGVLAIKGLGINPESFVAFGVFVAGSIVALVIGLRAWPALGRVLFQYGLAARLPVMVVMLVAMLGNWGTHYDLAPPNLPAMSPLTKWLVIGLVPQLTIWMAYTVVVGSIFGVVAGAIASRRPTSA